MTPWSLVWKEGTGTVHSGKSVLYIDISSHMLYTLYLYAYVRYAFVTHTLEYAYVDKCYNHGPSSKAQV